jgi:hypothetical protein
VVVLSSAYIVVGNYFPRAAPDRQAEQDSRGVLREAAAIVGKKSGAFAVHINYTCNTASLLVATAPEPP